MFGEPSQITLKPAGASWSRLVITCPLTVRPLNWTLTLSVALTIKWLPLYRESERAGEIQ
jgi:hypothetical protein